MNPYFIGTIVSHNGHNLWHCLKGPSAIQKALSVTRRLNNQSITDFKKKLSKAGSMLDENLCEKVNGSHRLSISHWSLVPPTATRSLSISCSYGHSRTRNIPKCIYKSPWRTYCSSPKLFQLAGRVIHGDYHVTPNFNSKVIFQRRDC